MVASKRPSRRDRSDDAGCGRDCAEFDDKQAMVHEKSGRRVSGSSGHLHLITRKTGARADPATAGGNLLLNFGNQSLRAADYGPAGREQFWQCAMTHPVCREGEQLL
jgi:hypothetical protein